MINNNNYQNNILTSEEKAKIREEIKAKAEIKIKEKNKVGRPRKIETPEIMWEYFEAYITKTKSNPILKHVFVGKNGESTYEERERPLTYEGFSNFLESIEVTQSPPDHYFWNVDNKYTDFLAICARIKKCIRENQIEGGMAGIYNPSITQRLNNLVEKSETTVVEMPLFPDENK
jgi:hypothetical protein